MGTCVDAVRWGSGHAQDCARLSEAKEALQEALDGLSAEKRSEAQGLRQQLAEAQEAAERGQEAMRQRETEARRETREEVRREYGDLEVRAEKDKEALNAAEAEVARLSEVRDAAIVCVALGDAPGPDRIYPILPRPLSPTGAGQGTARGA